MTNVNFRVTIRRDGSDYDLTDMVVKVPMDLTIEDPEGVMVEHAAGKIEDVIKANFKTDWPTITSLYEMADLRRVEPLLDRG
jgi:hypothetical protein